MEELTNQFNALEAEANEDDNLLSSKMSEILSIEKRFDKLKADEAEFQQQVDFD